jgi:CRISPR-associated protein Csx14
MSGFTVAVDLGNPGHLFACCGLLEASDRLWRGEALVTGHFVGDQFHVSAPRELDALLDWLLRAEVKQVEKQVKSVRGSNTGRIELTYDGSGDDPAALEWSDGSTWRLNSWSGEDYGRTRLKTFAGQMKGPKVVAHLLDWLRHTELDNPFLLFDRAQPSADASVFGFDARKGRAALDFGFSPDAIGLRTEEFPAVELFAAIGLQNFRPAQKYRELATRREPDLLFGLWSRPLPVELARAAAGCAFWAPGERRRCRFRLLGRKERSGVVGAPNDQYKAFTRAVVETLDADGDESE